MVDVTRLMTELQDFERALDKHSATVASDMQELQTRLAMLRAAWGGRAGREFSAHWERTERAFEAYTEGAKRLVPLLQGRVEALRRLDRNLEL